MHLSEKLATSNPEHPFFTFEFFPPRTDQGFDNLVSRISRLAKFNPLAISITWGAGGSTKERSLGLAGIAQVDYGIDTVLHLTCTNMEQGMVDDALRAAKRRGIETILALRGDPPRGQESWVPMDPRFTHGIDLVTYVRSTPEFASHFCIGVAAYPDGHCDRNALSEDEEIDHLKAKVDAGADFVVTQLFYDVDGFLRWMRKVRERGIKVPILPGIMPIQTYSTFVRLVKLCGAKVPPNVTSALEPINHDDQKVKDYGVDLAVSMIRRLLKETDIRGVHFCTLNLEKSVQRILETLEWIPQSTSVIQNKLISETSTTDPIHLITPTNATTTATTGLAKLHANDGEAGRGELDKAATWDDFPNGRFGDFKSPAYGNQGPWGSWSIPEPEALAQWGHPKTHIDLTNLFLRYLNSSISTTPFSPGPLSEESRLILPHLVNLTSRGIWTVGSQPAANCAPANDSVVGWGPKHGHVFQKAFVEFFCSSKVVQRIEEKVDAEGEGCVSWFAANYEKSEEMIRTNVSADERNAVTWGVFMGQEIVQTTIIEKASFLAWKEEAFSIWRSWASFYPPGSDEWVLLESVRRDKWLVNIIHHDYKNPEALWSFLFDGMSLES